MPQFYNKTPITSSPGDLQTVVTDTSNNPINPAKEDGNLATLAGTVSAGKVNIAGSVTSAPNFGTRQDTFTTTSNGITIDKSAAPIRFFSMQVKGTGASATSWTVVLESSLDGTNFSTILTHTNLIGDGQVIWLGGLDSPTLYFRSKVSALVLGGASNIVVTILGM